MKIAPLLTSITSVFANVSLTVTDDNDQTMPAATITYTAGGQTAIGVTDETGVLLVTLTAPASSLTASLSDGITVASIDVAYPAPVAPISAQTAFDVSAVQPAVTSELDKFKAQVAAIVAFVEHGVEVFGKDAEAELLAFKDKYL